MCMLSNLVTPDKFITPHSASDDLENPDKIRSLLKNLREARQAKSRDGIKQLDHSELSVSPHLIVRDIPSQCTILVAQLVFHGNQRN